MPLVEGIVVVFALVVVLATSSPTCCTRYSTQGSGMALHFLSCSPPGPPPSVARASRARGRGPAAHCGSGCPPGSSSCSRTCFLLPLVFTLPSPTGGSILDARLPPLSPGHLLGTDPVGNDIFSRILYGGQVSFEVSLASPPSAS